jgi:hypothetical protein
MDAMGAMVLPALFAAHDRISPDDETELAGPIMIVVTTTVGRE